MTATTALPHTHYQDIHATIPLTPIRCHPNAQSHSRANLPGLTSFAHSLTSGLDAVTAGLTLCWSSAGTKGTVNRIKKIKRQLYGRAEFELLRKMILLQ